MSRANETGHGAQPDQNTEQSNSQFGSDANSQPSRRQPRSTESPYGRGDHFSQYQGHYPQGGYGGFNHVKHDVGQVHWRENQDRYGMQKYGGQYGYPQPDFGGPGFESPEYQQFTPQGIHQDWDAMDPANYGQTNDGPFVGRGPKGYRRSDDRIVEDVCQNLSDHGLIDASDMEVSCSEGEVTLEGTCFDRQSKRLAEDVCDWVPGVHDVHNRLKVRRSGESGDPQSP